MFKSERSNFKHLPITTDSTTMSTIAAHRVAWSRDRVVGGGNMGGSCRVHINTGTAGPPHEEGEQDLVVKHLEAQGWLLTFKVERFV